MSADLLSSTTIAGVPCCALDTECAINEFQVGLLTTAGEHLLFTSRPGLGRPLKEFGPWFEKNHGNFLFLTFNGSGYDNALLDMVRRGYDDPAMLHDTSHSIIFANDDDRPRRRYSVNGELSLDLMLILKASVGDKLGSLKELGCKVGIQRLEELPVDPDQPITEDQARQLGLSYNLRDLEITLAVAKVAEPMIEQRLALMVEYGKPIYRVLNKPDSGLAEMILAHQLFGASKRDYPTSRIWHLDGKTLANKFSFQHPELQAFQQRLAARFMRWELLDGPDGPTIESPIIDDMVAIDEVTYRTNRGGLHSEDGPMVYEADDRFAMWDVDISGDYPAIITNHRICPVHLPRQMFIDEFNKLRLKRAAAKRDGHTALASALKTSCNSVFGKSGSAFVTWLQDPSAMTSVTVLGQLSLFKFVDLIAGFGGCKVVSCNTDGLLLRIERPMVAEVQRQCNELAAAMSFDLDWSEYSLYARRDVNNFCALGVDGAVKGRGAFRYEAMTPQSLTKKSWLCNGIVAIAAREKLLHDVPTEQTVRACSEVALFMDYQAMTRLYHVETEAGEHAGRVVRFYKAVDGCRLEKVKNADGKRSKLAEGVRLADVLPEQLPPDLDFAAYIAMADDLVNSVIAPDERVSNTIPLTELNGKQRATIADRIACKDADPERVHAAVNLDRTMSDWADCIKGNRNATALELLRRAWVSGNGTLTHGDLVWLGLQFTEADGYFAGSQVRNLHRMAEWVGRRISPFRLPQTPEEMAERALAWAAESVEPLKRRKKKLTHDNVLCSDVINGEVLRRYGKTRDGYKLACHIAAVSAKHTIELSVTFVADRIREAQAYWEAREGDFDSSITQEDHG